jgi:hypothetical protein
MNRRNFLTVVGGGSILAASLSIGGFTLTRTPKRALKPWKKAGSFYTDPRERALSYAILAPNPHNRQPWKIDLSQSDTIKVLIDTDRLLPHTDPFSRQITIGFGCFLEVLRMAAAEDGYRISEQLFPQGSDEKKLDNRPVAVVTFVKDKTVAKDPLFAHVLQRRSLKVPYDIQRPIPDKALAVLNASVKSHLRIDATNDPDQVASLRRLTTSALKLEINTPHTYKESVDLFRIGKAEVEANPDGIDFSGVLFDTLSLFGQFSRELALDRSSPAYKQGISAVLENTETAMGHVWLVSQTNTRKDQVSAGRDWVRINLAATGIGLGAQPLSQSLQEYPEMLDYYTEIHALLAPNGGTVQMLARLGYGKSVPPSPRWELSEKIIRTRL